MKKKFLTAALSMVLCLGMSVTAFAAPSPTTATTPAISSTEANNAGSAIYASTSTSYKDSSETVKTNVQKLATAVASNSQAEIHTALADLGMNYSADAVVAVTDVQAPENFKAGQLVEFKVPGLKPGFTVANVKHLKSDGTVESIAIQYIDVNRGVAAGYFNSLSIVAAELQRASASHYHYWQEYTVAPTATTWGYTMHYCDCGEQYADNYVAPGTSTAAAAGKGATSPKTAESSLPMVMLFAAAAACGAAVCVKRRTNA